MSSGPNREATQMRELGDTDLANKLRESKEELFNLRFQAVTGQLDNNRRLKAVRQDIARIYTVLRERELGMSTAPVVVEPKPESKPAKAKKADDKQVESGDKNVDEKEKSEVAA